MSLQQEHQHKLDITKIAAAIFCFLTIAAFYPGVMSPDSRDMLIQAETGIFVQTSAPIMTMLWRILNFFIWGPAPILIFQVVIWWLSLWLIFATLVPDNRSLKSRWIRILGMAVVGFWPTTFAMIGTIWNTVHMCIAYTVASSLLIRNRNSPKRSELYIAAICVAYGTGVRPNAIFSAIPLAVCIGVFFFRTYQDTALNALKVKGVRIVISSFVIIAAVFGGMAANKMIPARSFTPLQNLLTFDLAGISARTGTDDLIPNSARLVYERSPTSLASLYSAFTCVPLYLGTPQISARVLISDDPATRDPVKMLADLKQAWLKAVKQTPMVYLAHRTAVFFANMGWADIPPHYPFHRGITTNNFDLKATPSKFSNVVYLVLDTLLAKATLLFRPWIYLLFTLSIITACFVSRFLTGSRHLLTPVILGSSLLYTLPYFFVAPAADLRYHLWPIIAALLSIPLFWLELKQQSLKKIGYTKPIAALVGSTALYSVIAIILSFTIKPDMIFYGAAAPKSTKALEAYSAGIEHINKDEYTVARDFFLKAAESAPHWHIPFINLAIISKVLGNNEQASAYYDKAVELDVSNENALPNRAIYKIEKKEYQAAAQDVEISIKKGAANCQNYLIGAKAYAFLGKAHESAIYSYLCYKKNQSLFERNVVDVANIYFKEPELLEAGIQYFELLKIQIPNTWWVYLNLGNLLNKKGDNLAAEVALNRAKELKQ